MLNSNNGGRGRAIGILNTFSTLLRNSEEFLDVRNFVSTGYIKDWVAE